MKLPNAELEQAVSAEKSSYMIHGVLLDVEAKQLVATDGHIMAVVPVEVEDGDHRGIIPADAIRQARKMGKAAKTGASVMVNGQVSVTAGNQSATFEIEPGQFPNYQMVMVKMEGPATVTINASLLLRLAKALDNRSAQDKSHKKDVIVSLWIKDAQSAIGVKAARSENAGVIMPCRS